jgi:2'-5' RNA ligase
MDTGHLRQLISATPAGETWRAFIAVELPQQLREAIVGLRAQMPQQARDAVRWVAPENIHITLKFLGDVQPEQAVEVAQTLATACQPAGVLNLRAGSTGAFPSPRAARVLWVGFEGDTQPLVSLQRHIETALGGLGFERELDRFTPHATAGRVNRNSNGADQSAIGDAWSKVVLPPEARTPFAVQAVTLFRSHLGPDGSRYERLSVADLRQR